MRIGKSVVCLQESVSKTKAKVVFGKKNCGGMGKRPGEFHA